MPHSARVCLAPNQWKFGSTRDVFTFRRKVKLIQGRGNVTLDIAKCAGSLVGLWTKALCGFKLTAQNGESVAIR
jgi:hypothetical protein